MRAYCDSCRPHVKSVRGHRQTRDRRAMSGHRLDERHHRSLTGASLGTSAQSIASSSPSPKVEWVERSAVPSRTLLQKTLKSLHPQPPAPASLEPISPSHSAGCTWSTCRTPETCLLPGTLETRAGPHQVARPRDNTTRESTS